MIADGRTLIVAKLSPSRKNFTAIHFEGVTDRNSAEALRGFELEMPESELPPLPDGEYYHYQLIGCSVVDLTGRQIGLLSGIMETGSNDVYVVTPSDGREILIPATKDIVKEVDIVEKVVTVDPPEGTVKPAKPE